MREWLRALAECKQAGALVLIFPNRPLLPERDRKEFGSNPPLYLHGKRRPREKDRDNSLRTVGLDRTKGQI